MPKQSAVRRRAASAAELEQDERARAPRPAPAPPVRETLTIEKIKVSGSVETDQATQPPADPIFTDATKRYVTDANGVERPVRQPGIDAPALPEGGHAVKFVRFTEQMMLDMQRPQINTELVKNFRMRLIGPLLWIEYTQPGNGKRSVDVVPVTSIVQMKMAPEAAAA